jgi:hypothetical protein
MPTPRGKLFESYTLKTMRPCRLQDLKRGAENSRKAILRTVFWTQASNADTL